MFEIAPLAPVTDRYGSASAHPSLRWAIDHGTLAMAAAGIAILVLFLLAIANTSADAALSWGAPISCLVGGFSGALIGWAFGGLMSSIYSRYSASNYSPENWDCVIEDTDETDEHPPISPVKY